ncbi:MAG: hypothetical protein C4520_02375 [Candidatus Abyssobacteria bacterium SURF_5]|uniref:N-acetyl sugar amidotransferase n=1 Tax=Abyssobacteria bacterium (strain SURF_5) TaxID=2093360 RepID=A0A3A4NY81_ABYX5|nr:MAG: hypothetical protein C4520_02375 [Candidatus Abyssubacteria bacterium SURF_5]
MARCRRCLLTDAIPDVNLDEDGVCNECREFRPEVYEPDPVTREQQQRQLDSILTRYKGRGAYDVLVGLSGGKDSAYLIYRLKEEYGLRVLAYSFDNGFLPPAALKNIRQTLDTLKVDHYMARPSFDLLRKVYIYMLTRTSGSVILKLCPICASFYGNIAKSVASKFNIPVVAFGYSREQDDPNFRIPRSRYYAFATQFMPRDLFDNVLNADERAYLKEIYCDQVRKIMPNWLTRALAWELPTSQFRFAIRKWPMVVAPYKVWGYNPDENKKKAIELGLLADGKAHPLDTNCHLVPVMYYSDYKRQGWTVFVYELARLVRQGKVDRSIWAKEFDQGDLEVEEGTFRKETVDYVLDRLGITREQLTAKTAGG